MIRFLVVIVVNYSITRTSNIMFKETKSATMNIFRFFFIFFLNHL